MLAKIGSDMNKPNGQFFLKADADAIRDFMAKLVIRKIPGIGRMTELILNNLGVKTCSDIIAKKTELLICFRDGTARWLLMSSLGISRVYHSASDEDSI